MIYVYEADCSDFSGNGLGPLDPMSAEVTETLNGEYELTLEHPIDDNGKWRRLTMGCILRAPVPAGYTPAVKTSTAATESTEVWRVIDGVTSSLYLRTGPGMNYNAISSYKKRTEVVVLSKTDSPWYEVTAPDGKHGWMHSGYLSYVRTATSAQAAVETIQESRQLRDQPFRVYKITPSLDRITVNARHIFYDLMDNMILSYKPAATDTGAAVLQGISGACEESHDFTFYSDLDTTAEEVEFEGVNPVEAIMDEEGLLGKYKGELQRDWWDVYAVKRVGSDSDVQIREAKNLLGITYEIDMSSVATRIMPVGQDKDGDPLYLPEVYIDSPHISDYGHPKWLKLDVSEAKEKDSGDDAKTKEQCYTLMRAKVQEQLDAGCDAPAVTADVSFIDVADTEEYRDYRFLQGIFLGDSVTVLAPRIGVEVTLRMTEYTYDCLTRQYTQMTLGTVAGTLESSKISARQLPSGVVTAGKIAAGSVGASALAAGSVTAGKLADGVIDTDEIADGAVTSDKLGSGAVTDAKVASSGVSAAKITSGTLDAARLPFKIAWGTVSATSSSATAPMMNYSAAGFTSLPSVVCSFAKEGSNDAGDWGSLKIFDKTLTGAKVVIGGSGGITKSVDWVAIGI